jgi:hypothetical protein
LACPTRRAVAEWRRMLKRLLIGVIKGLLLGGLVYAGLVFGLHMVFSGGIIAYVLAVVLGALTGLIAGKPIWRSGAGVEAGLKAFFGMGLAALGMYLVDRFVPLTTLMQTFAPSSVPGTTPGYNLLALPVISTILAMLYEVDNTPEPEGAEKKGEAAPKQLSGARVANLDDVPLDDIEEPVAPVRKTNKR